MIYIKTFATHIYKVESENDIDVTLRYCNPDERYLKVLTDKGHDKGLAKLARKKIKEWKKENV